MAKHNLADMNQSAYRACHSTESALIKVKNVLMMSIIDTLFFLCYWIFQQPLIQSTMQFYCHAYQPALVSLDLHLTGSDLTQLDGLAVWI